MIGTAIGLLACLAPMACFLAASVVLAVHGHPYFASVSMMFAILTLPKISLGGRDVKEADDKGKDE